MPSVRIGTSGWVYPHWRQRFYPLNLPMSQWLRFYTQNFDTVEVNNSFYRLPKRETFERWRADTPEDFVFAVKGSRFITHMKKLSDVGDALNRFFRAVEGLGEKLQVVLWQLPPNLKSDHERLSSFLKALPLSYRYAVEFRHSSWWQDKSVWRVLEQFKVAHCIPILPVIPKEIAKFVTAPFVYLRFHGWNGLYASCFPQEELEWWAEKIREWLRHGLTVFAYFNNDANAFAIQNALTLKKLVTKFAHTFKDLSS
ncbi:MAG: DUF72 domain-containing protein [Armatimonadota bacterium]|nr:DUF72 domain-containing protein [Armatimonadota bacterium]